MNQSGGPTNTDVPRAALKESTGVTNHFNGGSGVLNVPGSYSSEPACKIVGALRTRTPE